MKRLLHGAILVPALTFCLGLGLAGGAFLAGALAGTNTLTSVAGGVVRTTHVNQYYTAMNQDLVPRNSTGVATNNGGSLGSSSNKWLKKWVASGDWQAGDIKARHTYNGVLARCGQGWMNADGRVINEANYDAEGGHATGDWDIYVITSPLDGKTLPNLVARYVVGVANTTLDPPTAVGNASNQINIQHDHSMQAHTHTVGAHQHQWYIDSASGVNDKSFTSPGASQVDINDSSEGITDWGIMITNIATNTQIGRSFFTDNQVAFASGTPSVANTDNDLSATQSIQPDSVQFMYCMRVID